MKAYRIFVSISLVIIIILLGTLVGIEIYAGQKIKTESTSVTNKVNSFNQNVSGINKNLQNINSELKLENSNLSARTLP